MKKIMSLFLSLVMLVTAASASVVPSYADDVEYTTINTNGTWYEGYISDSNTTEWYKLNVPSDGIITIKVMYYAYIMNYDLYNDDLSNHLGGKSHYGGSEDSPVTETYQYSLSKGMYFIKICRYNTINGKFKVSSNFKTYGTNEKEPNDYEHASTLLTNNSIRGCFTCQDTVDWYKFYISEKSNIKVKVKYYAYIMNYDIYNDDLSNHLGGKSHYGGSEDSPVTETYEYTLTKGTYFIKMSRYNDISGKYELSWDMDVKVSKPNDFRVTTRNTTSLKFSWNKVNGVSGYQLQRKVNGEYKTLTNTTSTSYTVKNLSAGTTYAFRVRAYKTIDGKKYYSGWKTLNTPTKPSKPSIKTPSTNKKHQIIAKWNKVIRCSGYQVQFSKQKNFSSIIATKTVSGQSKTSCTGNNFTKGKTYYVRVRSYKMVNGTKYYSVWSSVKSIKCK